LIIRLGLRCVAGVPATVLNGSLDWGYILKSFLFLPAYSEQGGLHPLLAVGWTLNFEMFFYVVFALALWLRVPPLPFVSLLFAGLSVAALFRQPDWPALAFWMNTILLEFVAGMAIARMCMTGVRVSPAVAAAMTATGFAGLLWPWGVVPDMMRVLTWGIPAALIVAGVAQLEPLLQGRVPTQLMRLGDSSYALYLFHPMIAPAAPALLAKVAFPNAPLSILLSTALAIAAALVVYRYGERCVTEMLKATLDDLKRRRPERAGAVDRTTA
jgi:exopolysaccharide production protein ExoZ